jgi:hypothetical protein
MMIDSTPRIGLHLSSAVSCDDDDDGDDNNDDNDYNDNYYHDDNDDNLTSDANFTY